MDELDGIEGQTMTSKLKKKPHSKTFEVKILKNFEKIVENSIVSIKDE